MPYKGYKDKERRKGYLKNYMRGYRARNRGRSQKQLLELKHVIDDLENLVHKGV